MAKKRSVSTSRADRADDRRQRNAPLRKRSRFDQVEEDRLMGPAPRKFMHDREPRRNRVENAVDTLRYKVVEGISYPIFWGTNYDGFRAEDSRAKQFAKNETRTSKLRRTSTRFGNSPDLSKAAGGNVRSQKRLTVDKAEIKRQRSANKSASGKSASRTKRRER